MKSDKQTKREEPRREGKTDVPGQNPKQNDSPSHDEHNDQNRRNLYQKGFAS